MKRVATLLVSTLVFSVAVCTTAHAAAIFLETWSNPGDIAGWHNYGLSLTQSSGALNWSLDPGSTYGVVFADSASSGGAFVGDVLSTGAPYYAFDLRPDPGTTLTDLTVYIDSATSTWRYALTPPQAGQGRGYLLPFDADPGHWIHQFGPETLAQTLTGVTALTIEFDTAADGASGEIDDMGLGQSPEPGTLCLLLGGIGTLALRRRRLRLTA